MIRRLGKALFTGVAVLAALLPPTVIATAPGKHETGRRDGTSVASERRLAEGGGAAGVTEAAGQRRTDVRTEALQPLIPLMERLSLFPAETLLAVPGTPDSTLRAVLALQGLSRQLALEAQAPVDEKNEVSTAGDRLQPDPPRPAAGKTARHRRGEVTDNAAAETRREPADAEAGRTERPERADAAVPVVEAQPSSDVVRPEKPNHVVAQQAGGGMSVDPVAAGISASDVVPYGRFRPPLTGIAAARWNSEGDDGPANGVTYAAPAGARVMAPCAGRVVFADRFRTYGLLLILDCGSGYAMVLSGLDRLDVRLDEMVAAGVPVGVMPVPEAGPHGHRPTLYVELRRDGIPVDPALWMRRNS